MTDTELPDTGIQATHGYRGHECQVTLSGRITIDSSPDLRKLLLRHLESPTCETLTLDFREVVYVDTSGLAVLLEILKAARINGKTLRLSRLRERPRYLLETTRLMHLFHDVNNEEPQLNRSSSESRQ